ncbi:hypothetical protein SAY87_022966 [Trapa incisa]|uniref:Fe2OG dioxygenase domain-containing protein n=1 Tax=Trapa incisa TaxID=236973 RepID=A0AAN7KB28_9MYRT|nr:hypothetical protein SAY87_022966 [Trapa incisa]
MQKTVQELVTVSNGDRDLDLETVPERFIREAVKEGQQQGAEGGEVPLVDVPVIDLSLLPLSHPPASPEADAELQSFHRALTSWGCIQVINHGMTDAFLDQVREVAKVFFSLPSEEKRRYLRADNGIEGYGTDMVLSDHQVLDWNDRLSLFVYPEDCRKLEYWPQIPETFREILHEYTLKLRDTVDAVFKAMATSLNLYSNLFLQAFRGKVTLIARFNYYPQCPRPELVYGLKPHADGSAIIVVLPDREVGGLQFLKDDNWVKIPIIPHALLINVGDQVEIMSNGVFKSPMHRVIPSSDHGRISLAMFCAPDAEEEIGPVSELVDESRPRLYKNVKDYPKIYFHHYQQGKRPIDAVKL